MNREKVKEMAVKVLDAWNSHDPEQVVSCYSEDCLYLDPNTRGYVKGRDDFRRYLRRLFKDWRMHWTLREFHLFSEENSGGAFLWHAELTPVAGGETIDVDGMDLVMIDGGVVSRNEVYFDKMAMLSKKED